MAPPHCSSNQEEEQCCQQEEEDGDGSKQEGEALLDAEVVLLDTERSVVAGQRSPPESPVPGSRLHTSLLQPGDIDLERGEGEGGERGGERGKHFNSIKVNRT